MNKRKIVIICLVIVFFIIAIMLLKTKSASELKNRALLPEEKTQIEYSEEYGVYYVTEEGTDRILYISNDADDPELQFYLKHPDYNPNPLAPKSTSLENYKLQEIE